MQRKPVTISGNEFNEKIKNNLRDYYLYQFKRFQKNEASDYRKKGTDEFKPASTFTEEKQRLIAMLESHAQMEWIVAKGGVCCCSTDTRTLETNPFWEPYRFCYASKRYIGWFLSMVLFLDPQMQLRRPDGSTEPVFPQILWRFRPGIAVHRNNTKSDEARFNLYNQLGAVYGDQWWGEAYLERYFSLFRQRINFRKEVLEEDPKCFGVPRELLQRYYLKQCAGGDVEEEQFQNRLDGVCSGMFCSKQINRRREQWRLSRNRLDLPPENEDLRFRFRQMAAFFSQTLPLGFVGMRLQQRAGEDRNLIRYKHNYIIKALNDYNIADLLHAIGQEIWLRVEFRNGTKLRYQQMVCLPLQIRESTQDGRQYLMYYHPGYRSLGSLRLDFIDRITYGTVEECPWFAEEIARAREMLKTVWSSSVPGFETGNLMRPQSSVHIRMVIRTDLPITERRLRREARHGRITTVDEAAQMLTYEVDVADPGEMIPWIRSLSHRVMEIWVDDVACYPRSADPATELRAHMDQRAQMEPELPNRRDLRDDVKFRALKNQRYPHEYLFTPLSGVFFDTVVQTVFEMMEHPDQNYSVADVKRRLRRAWPGEIQLQDGVLENMFDAITRLCSGSEETGYQLKYIPTEEYRLSWRTFWDMLPLSDLEASYLKGILLHSKARLFLSEQEIELLLSGLEGSVEPLCFSSVYYHDQHCDVTACYQAESVRKNFAMLMDSAAGGGVLDTIYGSQTGTKTSSLTVIRLEYSKREDRFRALCADDDGSVSFRNLERFVSILPTARTKDLRQLQLAADADAAENNRRLVLTFPNERNRAERIATEFSSWKKICTSRQENGVQIYVMELFYDVRDAAEIAVRLLSYGRGISVVQDSGDVARQLELRRTREMTGGHP